MVFNNFFGQKSLQKNLKARYYKLDKGYRLVYELSYFDEKKFLLYFHYKGGPLPKKGRKFFIIE